MDSDDLDAVLDRIDEIEIYLETRSEKIQAYEELAAGLDEGTVAWAETLIGASDHHQHVGNPEIALELLEKVQASGVEVSPSIEAHLFAFHLASGNEAEATAIERNLRQLSRDSDLGQDYGWIGESFEEAGRLQDALRWYSMANRDIEPDDFDVLDKQSLIGRLRVRQALGLPEDAYDVSAREWREDESRRWADED